MLLRLLRELDGERAVADSVLAERLGIPVSRIRNALPVLASLGYVEELEARPKGCRGCPLRDRCAGLLWRLTPKGKSAREELTHEKAV